MASPRPNYQSPEGTDEPPCDEPLTMGVGVVEQKPPNCGARSVMSAQYKPLRHCPIPLPQRALMPPGVEVATGRGGAEEAKRAVQSPGIETSQPMRVHVAEALRDVLLQILQPSNHARQFASGTNVDPLNSPTTTVALASALPALFDMVKTGR